MAGHRPRPRPAGARPTRPAPFAAGAACLALLAGAALGCGTPEPEITPATAEADRLLYERAEAAMEEESWSRAREYYVQIRDNYPQSDLRADARLSVGETYFREGTLASYVAAQADLREFLRLYPSHRLSARAQYLLGMVYFEQMRSPQRDQTETHEAIGEFERFIELAVTNPTFAAGVDDALLAEVRNRLREARDRLSDSSFVVGRFYYRNKYYPGAIDRFREILDDDPGYSRRDQIYYHLASSLAASDRGREALPMFERLVAEYPSTEFLEDATEQIAALRTSMDLDSP
ncbi:MAG: outer membrane protein assembly factor BamD [Acidobacteria bacterium]|nr:outer membrane protein assembly factor BamD [Acidobacteriota bacterium]